MMFPEYPSIPRSFNAARCEVTPEVHMQAASSRWCHDSVPDATR